MPDARIAMSQKDIDRYIILKKLVAKKITVAKAAELIACTTRHIWRLKTVVEAGGAAALVHGNCGRKSNRCIPETERKQIITLLTNHYPDFGPTLATEHLADDHDIHRDPKTIRHIMITEDLWKPRRGKKVARHRSWRVRRAHPGELEQFDGSYHNWLEGRDGTDEQCLLAAIDDAEGKIKDAQFADHEGVFPVFRFWKHYVEQFGKPRGIYLDKFSTYRTQERFKKEQEDLQTQFERAMTQLRIEPVTAHSPQAKGRVERLFATLQDRLVKEMRLKNICTLEEANCFLREKFIPDFNKRFAVVPQSKEDLHRPLTQKERNDCASIFSRHTTRTINNDFTVSLNNQWFQIDPTSRMAIRPKEKVIVEEHLDDTIHIRLRGKELNMHPLPERPQKAPLTTASSWALTTSSPLPKSTAVKPASNHPWRQHAAVGSAKKRLKV